MRYNTNYINQDAGCGTPREYYRHRVVDNKNEIYCPNCDKISNKKKKCLKCEKEITPTCRLMNLCMYCANVNEKFSETFNVNRTINTEL